ncbi:MAG: hypothetical protein R2681_14150 [Pyrinomonadaceae bacterium]
MFSTSFKPISRKTDIVIQRIDNEVLIYDLAANKAFCLNHPAAVIWETCDGSRSVADLKKIAETNLKTILTSEFVYFALNQLSENGLIDDFSELKEHFKAVSRREMVRRVGLTSAVGVPLVASIVAPRSVNAQSDVCTAVIDGCQCNPGFMSGDDCTGSTQAGMACLNPGCRCIASPGFDDCLP